MTNFSKKLDLFLAGVISPIIYMYLMSKTIIRIIARKSLVELSEEEILSIQKESIKETLLNICITTVTIILFYYFTLFSFGFSLILAESIMCLTNGVRNVLGIININHDVE